MGSLRALSLFALTASSSGCDSFDEEFTDCNLGTITGAWRIHPTARTCQSPYDITITPL